MAKQNVLQYQVYNYDSLLMTHFTLYDQRCKVNVKLNQSGRQKPSLSPWLHISLSPSFSLTTNSLSLSHTHSISLSLFPSLSLTLSLSLSPSLSLTLSLSLSHSPLLCLSLSLYLSLSLSLTYSLHNSLCPSGQAVSVHDWLIDCFKSS